MREAPAAACTLRVDVHDECMVGEYLPHGCMGLGFPVWDFDVIYHGEWVMSLWVMRFRVLHTHSFSISLSFEPHDLMG